MIQERIVLEKIFERLLFPCHAASLSSVFIVNLINEVTSDADYHKKLRDKAR